MFKYKIFGLNVLSEYEMVCYKNQFIKEDVKISIIDNIPEYINGNEINIEGDTCKYYIEDVGYFEIVDGKKINVCPFIHAAKRSVELFTLGSAFGILLYQRGEFPLHGAVLCLNDISVSIVGDSGAGKSSLATAMSLKDWKIITDDVMRIDNSPNVSYVESSYPSQKIWKTTADALNICLDGCDAIFNRLSKYFVDEGPRFSNKKVKLDYIFEIKECDVQKVEIIELNSAEALDVLLSNSYRFYMVEYLNLSREHFVFMLDLLKNIKVFQILRPTNKFSVENQINSIIQRIGVYKDEIH